MTLLLLADLTIFNKMKQLLSDDTKFKPMTSNHTKAREDSLSSYLRKLRKDGIIDSTVFQKILPGGSSPGVAYQKFTRLDAPSGLLFPQWTRTITA